jgi:hypothetical protein
MAPNHSVYMDPSPPFDWDPPIHWSLAEPVTKKQPTKATPLPRQNSTQLGTSAPPSHPGHNGRESGQQEHVPPGHAGHREINNSFFQPASGYKIEDYSGYPGSHAAEFKPGLRPQPYLTAGQAQERAAPVSQGGQAQQGEALVQEKEPSCCVIL